MHKQFIWQLFSREEFGSIDIRASSRKSPGGGGGGGMRLLSNFNAQ